MFHTVGIEAGESDTVHIQVEEGRYFSSVMVDDEELLFFRAVAPGAQA